MRMLPNTAVVLLSVGSALVAGCPKPDTDSAVNTDAVVADSGPDIDAGLADSGASTDAAATDSGTTGLTAAERFCGAVVPGVCATVFGCCDAAAQMSFGGSEMACNAMSMAECMTDWAPLDAAEANGRILMDSARLTACDAALVALAGSCDANMLATLIFECYPAVVGQVADFGTCDIPVTDFDWAECATGYCDVGQCTPWLAPGADCSMGGLCDVNNMRCVDDGGGQSCSLPVPDGGSCTGAFECASLYCAPMMGGTCMPYLAMDVCADVF